MDHNENQHHLMDQYIMGQLTGKTLLDFESELQNDSGLAKEFELYQQMFAGINAYGNRQLKEELKVVHNKVTNQPVKVRPIWYKYATAA